MIKTNERAKINKQKEENENKVNVYKSTFKTINNIIFITIICFVDSKALFIILFDSKHCVQMISFGLMYTLC